LLYNGERKKSDMILIGGIIGLLGVGGIQRFMIGQIGMGIFNYSPSLDNYFAKIS